MKNVIKRSLASALALMMLFSVFVPVVSSATISELTFSAAMVSGATEVSAGNWVYTVPQNDSLTAHRFVYRVSYSSSGEGEYAPGEFVITLPTQVFTDRSGNDATAYDVAIPYKDTVAPDNTTVEFVYEEITQNGVPMIRISNRKALSAAMSGNVEVAYSTTEQALDFKDMQKHADITATLTAEGQTRTATATGVKLDTGAEINYVSKGSPSLYTSWQSRWGDATKPVNDDGYYYLLWPITTRLSRANQPYTFTLSDSISGEDGTVVGYMFENTTSFSASNSVANQTSDYRYDYILTKHTKLENAPEHEYNLKNVVTATVMGEDNEDASSTASSNKSYSHMEPRLGWGEGEYSATHYSTKNSNLLAELKSGEVTEISGLSFNSSISGYTNADTALDPSNVTSADDLGKVDVTFSLEDKDVYLSKYSYAYSSMPKLASADYDMTAVQLWSTCYDKPASGQTYGARMAFSGVVYAYVNGAYVKAADFTCTPTPGSNTSTYTYSNINDACVSGTSGNTVYFNAGVDGCKVELTTKGYYVTHNISTYIKLFRTENVLSIIKPDPDPDPAVYYLHNGVTHLVYKTVDNNNVTIVRKYSHASADIRRVYVDSNIDHRVESTENDKQNKCYNVTWSVNMREDERLDYYTTYGMVEQNGGTFYVLLPKGAGVDKNSVVVTDNSGTISKGYYSVSTSLNYKGTGRTLLKVKINKAGCNYRLSYVTTYPWEAVVDLGTNLVSNAAYETGNESIAHGRPDDGRGNANMADLDPNTNANRFIYADTSFNLTQLIASNIGLTGKVISSQDTNPVSSTIVCQSESYAYQIRVANSNLDTYKDIIFFDSLENFVNNGTPSDWRGTLSGVDVSGLEAKGVAPKIYYSTTANLDINANHDLSASVWTLADENTDLSAAKAIAVDCRKKADDSDFVLDKGESMSFNLYMQSPASINSSKDHPEAYNSVYMDAKQNDAPTSTLIWHEYTTVEFRTTADVDLKKVSSTDATQPVEGIMFRLEGTSFYGTKYNLLASSDSNGFFSFYDIERGTYTLTEVEGIPDYLQDHSAVTVEVAANGTVTVTDKDLSGGKFIITNDPRVHGDLKFVKLEQYEGVSRRLRDAGFALYGTSDYGNDIYVTASSDDNGEVRFDNIEKGTYTLLETVYPAGMINSGTRYTVKCNSAGDVSIEGLTPNEFGDYEIINEPYVALTLHKVDASNPTVSLAAADFRLTRAGSGTAYDQTVRSDENGIVRFENLEAGTYLLEEVAAPPGYVLDTIKRVVTVAANHSVTVSGLSANEYGFFTYPNERALNGKIKITKVWKDFSSDASRPVPAVHISTREPDGTTAFPIATLDKSKLFQSGNEWTKNTITRFEKTSETFASEKDLTTAHSNAVRIDDNPSGPPIYAWKDPTAAGVVVKWWTNAYIAYLPANCYHLFGYTSKFADTALTYLDLNGWNTSKVTTMEGMFRYCKKLERIAGIEDINTSNVTDLSYTFEDCYKLSGLSGKLDLSKWDVSKVTSLAYTFNDCDSITELDLSGWRLLSLSSSGMGYTFYDLDNLKKIYATDYFNYSNSTQNCFQYCPLLAGGNGTSTSSGYYFASYARVDDPANGRPGYFTAPASAVYAQSPPVMDETKFTSAINAFTKNSITAFKRNTALDLSEVLQKDGVQRVDREVDSQAVYMWKEGTEVYWWCSTPTVTMPVSCDSLFEGCTSLVSVDTTGWDMRVVGSLNKMFKDCSALTSITFGQWKFNKTVSLDRCFQNCTSLTSIDLAAWGNISVDSLFYCFYNCSKIVSLDLSGFDTSKCTGSNDYSYTFSNCSKLETIYASDKFVVGSSPTCLHIFDNCTKLVGGNGTTYNSSNDAKTYTRIDAPGTPGYLTAKNPPGQYDSVADNWVKNGDGTWTYTFDVFDDSTVYRFWEDPITDYTSDGYQANNRYINMDEVTKELTVTNTSGDYFEPSGYGTVTVETHVTGMTPEEAAEYDFNYTITLSAPAGDENVSSHWYDGTKIFGGYVFTDGVATFTLKDGQTATFPDIPAGLNYTVVQDPVPIFTTTQTGDTGSIAANTTSQAVFYNAYAPTGRDVIVRNTITGGEAGDKNDFTVILGGLEPNMTYRLSNGTTYKSDSSGDALVTFRLGDGESITILDLPVGATYRATESASDFTASYTVTDAGNQNKINSISGANDTANKPLSTAGETVDADESVTISFLNVKEPEPEPELTKDITINVQWVNDLEQFRPDSVIVYVYAGENLVKTVTVTAEDNWTTTLTEMPVKDIFGNNIIYSVTEEELDTYYPPEITHTYKDNDVTKDETFVVTNTNGAVYLTHTLYEDSNGTGTCSAEVKVYNENNQLVDTITTDQSGTLFIPPQYIDPDFNGKLEVTLVTDSDADSQFKNFCEGISHSYAAVLTSSGVSGVTGSVTFTDTPKRHDTASFTIQTDNLFNNDDSIKYPLLPFYSWIVKPTLNVELIYSYESNIGSRQNYGDQSYKVTLEEDIIDEPQEGQLKFFEWDPAMTTSDGHTGGYKVIPEMLPTLLAMNCPYEKNIREDLVWDYTDSSKYSQTTDYANDKITVTMAATQTVDETRDVQFKLPYYARTTADDGTIFYYDGDKNERVKDASDGEPSITVDGVKYDKVIDGQTKHATRYILKNAESEEDILYMSAPKQLFSSDYSTTRYFQYWSIQTIPDGDYSEGNAANQYEIARCYYEKFNFAIYQDCIVEPIYGDSVSTHAHTDMATITFVENGRNKWNLEKGRAAAASGDRIFSDFMVSFDRVDKLMLKKNTNSGITTGVLFQKWQPLTSGNMDDGHALSSQEYKARFMQSLAESETTLDTYKTETVLPNITGSLGEGFLNSNIPLNQLDNKNRIEFVRAFANTQINTDYVYAAYAYMKEANGTTVTLSDPVFFTIYDIANITDAYDQSNFSGN